MRTTGFIAYGIYDKELAEEIQKLLKTHNAYPLTTIGKISVSDNVVSVTRKLEDIADFGYYIFSLLEDDKDGRNKKQIDFRINNRDTKFFKRSHKENRMQHMENQYSGKAIKSRL